MKFANGAWVDMKDGSRMGGTVVWGSQNPFSPITFYQVEWPGGVTAIVNETDLVDHITTTFRWYGDVRGVGDGIQIKLKTCECGAHKVKDAGHAFWCDLSPSKVA